MRTGTPSLYFCPTCDKQLHRIESEKKIVVFCPWSTCDSLVSNYGAEGKDEKDAYYNLVKSIENE